MGRSKVCGVGVNDWHEPTTYHIGDKKYNIKEYNLWFAMITRCYSEYTKKVRPTYEGVECQESWLSMKSFISDVSKMVGYDRSFTDGWVLDKDILVKGNNLYSVETCCFVPSEINGCLTLRIRHRGSLPLGITLNDKTGKYVARCGYDGKRLSLGHFNSVDEAFSAYRQCKKKELARLAEKWKGCIDDKVYYKLLEWDFTIYD